MNECTHFIYTNNYYGYPEPVGLATLKREDPMTWHYLYTRVGEMRPGFQFTDPDRGMHIFIVPLHLYDNARLIGAAIGVLSSGGDMASPSSSSTDKSCTGPSRAS